MRRASTVAALAALILGVGSAAGGERSNRSGAPAISGEQALAATLQWNELERAGRAGGSGFWPELPQFNTGLDVGPVPLAEAVQLYDYTGPDAERAGAQIVSSIIVFRTDSEAVADEAVTRRLDGGTTLHGPRVAADAWRYSTKAAGKLTELTLRWRIGSAAGRLSASDRFPWTPALLSALFKPVAERVQQLLRGGLRAPSLAHSELALLPAPSAAPGRAIGTAKLPAEAWASVDSGRDPKGALGKLRHDGLGTLLERTYLLATPAKNAVSVVLFAFASPAGATAWVKDFIRLTGSGLDPGKTGSTSAFAANHGNFYELQFARGRYVGDVACSSPFGKTSPQCEAITRTLAERWYAALA